MVVVVVVEVGGWGVEEGRVTCVDDDAVEVVFCFVSVRRLFTPRQHVRRLRGSGSARHANSSPATPLLKETPSRTRRTHVDRRMDTTQSSSSSDDDNVEDDDGDGGDDDDDAGGGDDVSDVV